MCNFWTSFVIKICLQARKVIFPGLSRNRLPGLFTMPLIIMTEVLRRLFVLKFIASLSVLCCCCCCFFFLSSTELHEVNNYDTNLSTEANASTPRYGPEPYFVVIGTNQHGIASGEKSFFFAKRGATVLPIYFHFLWATDVTNIIGMRN